MASRGSCGGKLQMMTMTLDVEALRPADTPEYMTGAWFGCISWALGQPEIVAAFRAETGNNWQPASDVFGQMIDKATGVDRAFLRDFIQWVNVNLWGPIGSAPDDKPQR